MSLRNLRKLQNSLQKSTTSENISEDEFEPTFQKKSFVFSQLQISSESEQEDEMENKNQELSPTPGPSQTKMKKANRKKKKQKKKDEMANVYDIDACLKEVNDLLGPVEPTEEKTSENNEEKEYKTLMKTAKKYFSREYDYTKLLGTYAVMENKKKTERGHVRGCITRARIVDKNFDIKSPGLGMSITKKRDGLTFFRFDHNGKYLDMQRKFWTNVLTTNIDEAYLTEARDSNNVEAMLQQVDYLFEIEEYMAGYNLLEYCICVLQNATHHLFNITDMSVRLEYEVNVNRPFFVAILKYIHVHTLKAAHRAALECAKMLLNLDPTDPLAVLAIIDVLALRAREHQWLIDIDKHWAATRKTNCLPNFAYSLALANYHVAKKNKLDLDVANQLLNEAILRFPQGAIKIINFASGRVEDRIKKHALFEPHPSEVELDKLISLYAKMVWPKFSEDNIMKKWFAPRVTAFIDHFDKDPEMQRKSDEYTKSRRRAWPCLPDEVQRHFNVIINMGSLIIDEKFPGRRNFVAADPPPGNFANNTWS